MHISTGRVYISRDVVFDEGVFPFSLLHSNAGSRLQQDILLLPPHLISHDWAMNTSVTNIANDLPEPCELLSDSAGSDSAVAVPKLAALPFLTGLDSGNTAVVAPVSNDVLGAHSVIDLGDQPTASADTVSTDLVSQVVSPPQPLPTPGSPAMPAPLSPVPVEPSATSDPAATGSSMGLNLPASSVPDVAAMTSPRRIPSPPPGPPRPIHGPILPYHYDPGHDCKTTFASLKFTMMALFAMGSLLIIKYLVACVMLSLLLIGNQSWMMNMLLSFVTILGTWFLHRQIKI